MLETKVLGVTQFQGSGFPAVILGHEERILFISIGLPEASAIQLALLQEKTPRPMTHDLICNILAGLRADLVAVAVYKLEDQTFFAYLDVEQRTEGGEVEQVLRIDARPSDAIAIALRVGCPILVSETVMAEAGHDASILRALFEAQESTPEEGTTDFNDEEENEFGEGEE